MSDKVKGINQAIEKLEEILNAQDYSYHIREVIEALDILKGIPKVTVHEILTYYSSDNKLVKTINERIWGE